MEKVITRKSKKLTIIYRMIALLLFGSCFALTYEKGGKDGKNASVQIVMLGDSVLGECRDETSVVSRLSARLGENVFNGAFGGTGMSYMDSEKHLANVNECLSMVSLSRSIVSGDFGVQQSTRIRESMTFYFEETIDALEKIDFASVDILFLEHGVNDYHAGVPIRNEQDPYDTYTFTGAIRSTVELLQEKYPDMRIILMTPTYTWYPYHELPKLTCEEYNLGGGVLEEYVNAELALAESLGVEVIDNYHELYPHAEWSDWELYTNDGLHPNEAGRELMAQKIYDYLQKQ